MEAQQDFGVQPPVGAAAFKAEPESKVEPKPEPKPEPKTSGGRRRKTLASAEAEQASSGLPMAGATEAGLA